MSNFKKGLELCHKSNPNCIVPCYKVFSRRFRSDVWVTGAGAVLSVLTGLMQMGQSGLDATQSVTELVLSVCDADQSSTRHCLPVEFNKKSLSYQRSVQKPVQTQHFVYKL